MTAPLFPLFVDLRGRRVLVVGGGAGARRKVEALREAGARVRVGAPALEPTLAAWAAQGAIEHAPGRFAPSWLDGAWLVIAATDSPAINRAVAAAAEARRLWVNVVDDVDISAFHVPARVRRGPLQVAVSSGGAAPMLARSLRERLERELDPTLGELAALLARHRARLRAAFPDTRARRRFLASSRRRPGPIRARAR